MTLPHDRFSRMTLRDRLYLLAHDSDGQPLTHLPSIRLGLASATICDLILAERLTVQKGHINVTSALTVVDPVNAVVLDAIRESKPPRELRAWLKWLSGDIYDRCGSALHATGHVVRTTKHRLLGRDQVSYRAAWPETATYVCAPLFRAVCGTSYIEPPTYIMAGLVHALQLHQVIGINLGNRELLDALNVLAIRAEPPVVETIHAVRQLLGDAATAAHA